MQICKQFFFPVESKFSQRKSGHRFKKSQANFEAIINNEDVLNHSKFVTKQRPRIDKNELVTHIHRDLTSALWHLPRRVSRRKGGFQREWSNINDLIVDTSQKCNRTVLPSFYFCNSRFGAQRKLIESSLWTPNQDAQLVKIIEIERKYQTLAILRVALKMSDEDQGHDFGRK